ncbi:hypothetical protein [Actinobacillus equuli]|uniref:hypothetical protein n=1 Tax=Actinobacillus equuli TaxID=718 RepID=UPI00241869FF|nr:hypothetical protein [Actinobacillus equuli]MDG4952088.1 hypothetical protein [Actinobacillus equuli subsp. equuli]
MGFSLLTKEEKELFKSFNEVNSIDSESIDAKSVQKIEKPYNQTERNTHLQIIASLAFELSKTAQKYQRGNNINISAIAEIMENHANNFEDLRKAEAYRKRISEAVNFFNGAD